MPREARYFVLCESYHSGDSSEGARPAPVDTHGMNVQMVRTTEVEGNHAETSVRVNHIVKIFKGDDNEFIEGDHVRWFTTGWSRLVGLTFRSVDRQVYVRMPLHQTAFADSKLSSRVWFGLVSPEQVERVKMSEYPTLNDLHSRLL